MHIKPYTLDKLTSKNINRFVFRHLFTVSFYPFSRKIRLKSYRISRHRHNNTTIRIDRRMFILRLAYRYFFTVLLYCAILSVICLAAASSASCGVPCPFRTVSIAPSTSCLASGNTPINAPDVAVESAEACN